jgi:hypothetical protein
LKGDDDGTPSDAPGVGRAGQALAQNTVAAIAFPSGSPVCH